MEKSYSLVASDECGVILVDSLTASDRHVQIIHLQKQNTVVQLFFYILVWLWVLQEEALKFLGTVTSRASAGACKWAWLRLGLQQVRTGSCDDAILSLQAAVRADPSDV